MEDQQERRNPYDEEVDVSYTSWEFNEILSNKKLLDATIFYRDGKEVPTTKILEEVAEYSK